MVNSYDKNIKRGTIVYYKDGTIEVARYNNINEFKNNHLWSMGGYSVYPKMYFTEEKISGGVNYKTAHSYVGYKGNKIFLIAKPNHMIADIIPLAKTLGLQGMIVLDGGGSSQLNHIVGRYTSTRKINSAILLKEI